MKFDTEGTYTLTYTATDSCGNSISEERTVVVASPRTVLYTDGTFIINELPENRASNEALHGAAKNVYAPFDPNGATNVEKYIFSGAGVVPWHNMATNVTSVEIGESIQPTSTAFWFHDMQTCVAVDLTNLNTSSVTNMESMFFQCYLLTDVDLTMLNTANVTNMKNMFCGCHKLNPNLSSFDTSKVTTMEKMFMAMRTGSIDLSTFNTQNVTNMASMFRETKIPILNIQALDTSKVTTMQEMFYSYGGMNTIDLSGFDTANVTMMASMFRLCSLVTIDLSSFNTSKVEYMTTMFYDCSYLTTIYASNLFDTTIAYGDDMFAYSRGIVGGQGTRMSDSHTGKEYARIDNPPDAPGYFTLKPSA